MNTRALRVKPIATWFFVFALGLLALRVHGSCTRSELYYRELVSEVHEGDVVYQHFFVRKPPYTHLIERNGKQIFDSSKDGPMQGITVRDGQAVRIYFDSASKTTIYFLLP